MIYVQFGGFTDCPEGWINYEPSLHLRLQRLPLLGRLFEKLSPHRFPKDIRIGDIVKGLPLPPNSADVIFSSHVIEHLSKADALTAFKNVHQILKPGGLFRFVVPDMQSRCKYYVDHYKDLDDPSEWLMKATYLGIEHSDSKNLQSKLKKVFSTAHHKWMWDEKSIVAALHTIGFENISRTQHLGNPDALFARVEKKSRFFWSPDNTGVEFCELAIEARKPVLRKV